MKNLLTAIALVCAASLLVGVAGAEETERTWKGKWNNRKYGTSGPLECKTTSDGKGNWKAVFTGKFQGDPFRYEATFKSREVRKQTQLAGTATVRGHGYKWQGLMQQGTLQGKYTSTIGYFGEFTLKEKVARR